MLLILSRQPQAYSVLRLLEAAAARGIETRLLDPHALRLSVESGRISADGPDGLLDLTTLKVLPRIGSTATEFSLSALEHLEAGGAAVLNPAAGLHRLRSKFAMLGHLAAAGLPVPDSAMLRAAARVADVPSADPQLLDETVARLGGYPLVLKFIRGSQGLGVVYAADETTVRSVLEALNYAQYDVLLQRWHPAAARSDLRVLVLGGRARWAVRRQSAGGRFRSNIHRGGHALPVDIAAPEYAACAALAERAAAAFGLGLAGVDIIEGAPETGVGQASGLPEHVNASGTLAPPLPPALPLVLEVNSSPGFESAEAALGADIAGAITAHAAAL